MTTDERNAIIAGALEAAGHPDLAWNGAESCAQGHDRPPVSALMNLCPMCLYRDCTEPASEVVAHRADPDWHPEWRVGRVPKPFHTSVDLTITALNALGMDGIVADISSRESNGSPDAPDWSPAAIAEALGVCAVAVVQKEGGK